MILSERELCVVTAVFDSVLRRKDIHKWIGSETIKGMSSLYDKLRYREYCERHGIRYEDMTDEDFMDAYFEEQEE